MTLEADIVRQFLVGTTLNRIVRDLDTDNKMVFTVLLQNPATKPVFEAEYEKFKRHEYSPFFYKAKLGRDKLPENRKRKLRQIRISDQELEEMGNPSSTSMRDMMLEYKKMMKFFKYLDEEGIKLIPDEILHEEYDPHDPFWVQFIYSGGNGKIINEIAEKPKYWEKVKEALKS
jgi:hypothetical protein